MSNSNMENKEYVEDIFFHVIVGRALRVLFHRQLLAQAMPLNPDKSLLTNVSRDFFV
jgi:hypothetical protein